ncbi:hypothetical protein M569_11681 [Genlisea aurea]|uniref:Uncharacterized protein n=1 Tax=Genlisea aurea TaxID=192259 RepID=S8CF06_9LAMI|nr:hypothetical protein M569_11681 [Genlisea aurea]
MGYWDIVWDRPDVGTSHFDKLDGMNFGIVESGDDAVEVSFTKTWNVSLGADIVPLNIDKRYAES